MSWCIKKKKQESNKNLHFLSCITRILWKKKPSMYSKKVNEYISLWIKLILMGQHHFILWGCMWKFIPYHHISFVDEVKRWCTDEPQLSGFLDYADFFSGLNFVINIYWSWPRSVAIFLSLKKKKKKKKCNEKWSKGKFVLLITLNAHMMFFFETSWLTSTFQHFRPIFMNYYCK